MDTMFVDMSYLGDTEWSWDPPGLSPNQTLMRVKFLCSVILERKDAVMLALIGKQTECDNEQPLRYAKNSRLHILLFPPRPFLLDFFQLNNVNYYETFVYY